MTNEDPTNPKDNRNPQETGDLSGGGTGIQATEPPSEELPVISNSVSGAVAGTISGDERQRRLTGFFLDDPAFAAFSANPVFKNVVSGVIKLVDDRENIFAGSKGPVEEILPTIKNEFFSDREILAYLTDREISPLVKLPLADDKKLASFFLNLIMLLKDVFKDKIPVFFGGFNGRLTDFILEKGINDVSPHGLVALWDINRKNFSAGLADIENLIGISKIIGNKIPVHGLRMPANPDDAVEVHEQLMKGLIKLMDDNPGISAEEAAEQTLRNYHHQARDGEFVLSNLGYFKANQPPEKIKALLSDAFSVPLFAVSPDPFREYLKEEEIADLVKKEFDIESFGEHTDCFTAYMNGDDIRDALREILKSKDFQASLSRDKILANIKIIKQYLGDQDVLAYFKAAHTDRDFFPPQMFAEHEAVISAYLDEKERKDLLEQSFAIEHFVGLHDLYARYFSKEELEVMIREKLKQQWDCAHILKGMEIYRQYLDETTIRDFLKKRFRISALAKYKNTVESYLSPTEWMDGVEKNFNIYSLEEDEAEYLRLFGHEKTAVMVKNLLQKSRDGFYSGKALEILPVLRRYASDQGLKEYFRKEVPLKNIVEYEIRLKQLFSGEEMKAIIASNFEIDSFFDIDPGFFNAYFDPDEIADLVKGCLKKRLDSSAIGKVLQNLEALTRYLDASHLTKLIARADLSVYIFKENEQNIVRILGPEAARQCLARQFSTVVFCDNRDTYLHYFSGEEITALFGNHLQSSSYASANLLAHADIVRQYVSEDAIRNYLEAHFSITEFIKHEPLYTAFLGEDAVGQIVRKYLDERHYYDDDLGALFKNIGIVKKYLPDEAIKTFIGKKVSLHYFSEHEVDFSPILNEEEKRAYLRDKFSLFDFHDFADLYRRFFDRDAIAEMIKQSMQGREYGGYNNFCGIFLQHAETYKQYFEENEFEAFLLNYMEVGDLEKHEEEFMKLFPDREKTRTLLRRKYTPRSFKDARGIYDKYFDRDEISQLLMNNTSHDIVFMLGNSAAFAPYLAKEQLRHLFSELSIQEILQHEDVLKAYFDDADFKRLIGEEFSPSFLAMATDFCERYLSKQEIADLLIKTFEPQYFGSFLSYLDIFSKYLGKEQIRRYFLDSSLHTFFYAITQKREIVESYLDPAEITAAIEGKISDDPGTFLKNHKKFEDYLPEEKRDGHIRKIALENPEMFLNNAVREHWKILMGEEGFEEFLAALPGGGEEKRNAFTRNMYDRTLKFMAAISSRHKFLLDKDSLEIIKQYIQKFGLSRTPVLYIYFRNLTLHQNGKMDTLPPAMIADGITTMDSLESKFAEIMSTMFAPDPLIIDPEKISALEKEILRYLSGYSTHTWLNGRPDLPDIIKNYHQDYQDTAGEIAALPEGYAPKDFSVARLKADIDTTGISSDFKELVSDIRTAAADFNNFDSVRERAAESIETKIQAIQKDLERTDPAEKPGKIKGLTFEREKFMKLLADVRGAGDSEALLRLILTVKLKDAERMNLSKIMRQIVIMKTLKCNYPQPEQQQELLSTLDKGIDIESIGKLLSFTDDLIKDHALSEQRQAQDAYWTPETWKQIRTARKQSNLVNLWKLFDGKVKEVRESYKSMQENAKESNDNITIQAIPDRGLMGELSGYLANACYTAEYPLLKKYPNVIPYKFMMSPGGIEQPDFMGSVLIFELDAENGEKVMLVRAFNIPEENKIDLKGFFESFLDYLGDIAQKRGIRHVIVPGLRGAMSNYTLTTSHITQKYLKDENSINLKDPFAFNGYDITRNSFVARTVGEKKQGALPVGD